MLFTSLSQLEHDPLRGFVTLATFALALLVAITLHEFSHALSATHLGDPTARALGRLSLHPKAHLDPVGTVMIFLAGFGWGKPVPVNANYLRVGERPGMAIVSLAGPLANVVVAAIFSVLMKAGVVTSEFVGFSLFRGSTDDLVAYVVGSIVFWNLLLASFNLIPLAPLDGFKVALGVLPRAMAVSFARLERHGPTILIGIILFDLLVPGRGILFNLIRPILNTLSFVVLGRQLL